MCFKTHPWYSISDKIRSHFEWLYFIINGVPFQFRGAAIGSSFAYENHEWSSVGASTTPKSFKKHPESVLYLWTCIPLKRLIIMLMSHDSNGSYHLRNATVVLLHQQKFLSLQIRLGRRWTSSFIWSCNRVDSSWRSLDWWGSSCGYFPVFMW